MALSAEIVEKVTPAMEAAYVIATIHARAGAPVFARMAVDHPVIQKPSIETENITPIRVTRHPHAIFPSFLLMLFIIISQI